MNFALKNLIKENNRTKISETSNVTRKEMNTLNLKENIINNNNNNINNRTSRDNNKLEKIQVNLSDKNDAMKKMKQNMISILIIFFTCKNNKILNYQVK